MKLGVAMIRGSVLTALMMASAQAYEGWVNGNRGQWQAGVTAIIASFLPSVWEWFHTSTETTVVLPDAKVIVPESVVVIEENPKTDLATDSKSG